MKKVLFAVLLFLPMLVHADYSIDEYRVDVTINKNGDVDIIEAFSMEGIYNGFEKVINYRGNYDGYKGSKVISVENTKLYNADDLVLKEIRAINFNMSLPINSLINNSHLFTKSSKAVKGEYGIYTLNKRYNGVAYRIYNPSMLNKDFYISYTLENLAIKHEDISEVGLRLFEYTKEKIKKMEININVPNNDNYLNVWVHTKDNYVVQKDNKTIRITINDLKDNDFDIRVLYDRDALVTNKKSHKEAFDNVLEIEQRYKNDKSNEYDVIKEKAYLAVVSVEKTKSKDDYENAYEIVSNLKNDEFKTQLMVRLINVEPRVERRYMLLKIAATSCMSFIIIGILLIIYRMYRKESTCNIDRIPTKPYIIGYLYRKKVTRNDFIASLIKLIDDDVIKIEKTKKDYKLIRVVKDVNNVDDKLLNYIFEDNDDVTISKLKKRLNKRTAIDAYATWHNVAVGEAISRHYYEDLLFYKIFGIGYAILGIVASALLLGRPTYFSPIITIIISLMAIIFFLAFYKRTTMGSELFYQVLSIKQYVNNIDKVNVKKRTINECLRYAIIFGNFNKASAVLADLKNDDYFNYKVAVADSLINMFK